MFIESLTAKTRTRKKLLPFNLPSISDEEIQEVTASLQSGSLTIGPKTRMFENKFTEYVGAQHAIAVNSSMAAIHLALIAAGIGKDDEVILPTIAFAHTANAVVHCGAKPVLADVSDDFNLKIAEVTRLITPKTKAIIAFDFAGQPAALTELNAIARKNNLIMIEDAAQAIGSSHRGRKIGSVVPITVFSFCSTETLTTIDGGMIVTNNDEWAEMIRTLSLYGINKDTRRCFINRGSWYYEISQPGYKYFMNDIQASLGICQLSKLERFLAVRRRYANLYTEAFRFVSEIALPPVNSDSIHAWCLYVILLNLEKLNIKRAQFIEALRYENIETDVKFIPLHLHPFYQNSYGYLTGDFPNAEWLYERMISLPLYPKMTEDDVNDTIRAVRKIIQRMRK